MPKPILSKRRPTNLLVWCGTIICTIIAIAVIVTGLAIFISYMIIRPKVPFMAVIYAHLDKLDYSQTGQLDAQFTLNIIAENKNARVHASFSDLSFILYFHGLQIAQLRADPFDVPKNSSVILPYVVPSYSIPLEPAAMEVVDISLKQDKISFELKGQVKTRWKVGLVGSVKVWSHLSCQLRFSPSNGSSLHSHCSSRSNWFRDFIQMCFFLYMPNVGSVSFPYPIHVVDLNFLASFQFELWG